jgi:hypothetical protein
MLSVVRKAGKRSASRHSRLVTRQKMDKKSRFPIRKFDNPEAMKHEEYRYWQSRPASERIAAVSEITTEVYRLKNPSCNVSRLDRAKARLIQRKCPY